PVRYRHTDTARYVPQAISPAPSPGARIRNKHHRRTAIRRLVAGSLFLPVSRTNIDGLSLWFAPGRRAHPEFGCIDLVVRNHSVGSDRDQARVHHWPADSNTPECLRRTRDRLRGKCSRADNQPILRAGRRESAQLSYAGPSSEAMPRPGVPHFTSSDQDLVRPRDVSSSHWTAIQDG